MTDDVNPYSAPLETPVAPSGKPTAAALINGTIEFRGEVTENDHLSAVRQAGIRTDYSRSLKVSLFVAIPFTLLVALRLLDGDPESYQFILTSISALLTIIALVGFVAYQRWFIGTLIPSLQTESGPFNGRMDGDGLWITSSNESSFLPWHALVSTARGADVWVLSFNRQQLQWVTIPWNAFSDANQARMTASDLRRLYPPVKPQPHDVRRWNAPSEPCRFHPEGEHVFFEGPFFVEWLKGTASARWSKRIARHMQIVSFGLVGALALSLLLLTGWDPLVLLPGAIWISMVFVFIWVRLWMIQRKAKHDGKTVLFHSTGWFDPEGYFAMTQISQSRMKWKMFHEHEITDQVIALYPNPDEQYAFCAGREQFQSETDWQQACAWVRAGMARVQSS